MAEVTTTRLRFQIVSSRIVEAAEGEKKYVAYMLQARQGSESYVLDRDPVNVERRYTNFLDLYNGLKNEFPALLGSISFPRKVAVGNFDSNVINTRCKAFESLLDLIAGDSRLRDTPAAITFFQDTELNKAKQLLNDNEFDKALCVLETSFKLLNKVYTDRSRVVLGALCRIVACASTSDGSLAIHVERWAQLALKRYETVSDSDQLLVYIPLLHSCISIWETLGKDKSKLVEELNDLRKRGMKVDSVPSLMEAVENLVNTV